MNIYKLLIICCLFLLGCASNKDYKRIAQDNLYMDAAEIRKEQISDIHYQLSLKLYSMKNYFDGVGEIRFKFNDNGAPLTFDFKQGSVSKIVLNGEELKDYKTTPGFVEISNKYLTKENTLKIHYRQQYDKRARGLFYFLDPKDKNEYIFSDNEPYDAHHFFPCFDQPNLKARFQVTLDVPKDWQAISNTPASTELKRGKRKIVTFKKTKIISTYLLFIGAGDYAVVQSKSKKMPMRIFVRQSLKKYLDAKEIFDITEKGLAFYNSYFDYPYPFEKYDYIFSPGFGPGAMENPGAVTMNERMLYRGPVSRLVRARRANIILHEMVHMWFGDLVTMDWWNDLWLNESFATYLAYLGQDRALNDKGVWQAFYGSKGWAYWQDQLITTHPIETRQDIDVKSAKANFDGITYAKGASSLKQLHYFVGEKAFREGTRKYFKDNQWNNATRADFIGSIQNFTDKNLDRWTEKWLQTAGPNELRPSLLCKNGKIKEIKLLQTKSSSGHYSPHQTLVGLFKIQDNKLVSYASESTSIDDDEVVLSQLNGKSCPDFIFTNIDDYDYGLHYLDPRSEKTLLHHFGKIEDPMLKKMLWGTLYQMVYNYQLPPERYLNIIKNNIAQIKSPEVLDILLGRYGGVRQIYWSFMKKEQRKEWAVPIEKLAYQKLRTLSKNDPSYLLWLDFYINISSSKNALTQLHSFLKSKAPGKFKLDQKRRWEVLLQLATFNYPGIQKILTKELKRDYSDYSKMMYFTASVSIPSIKNKKQKWDDLILGDKPWRYKKNSFRHFHHVNYQDLSKDFLMSFFDFILKIDKDKEKSGFVSRYFSLLPFFEDRDLLELSKKVLKENQKSLKPTTKRAWFEANDMLERTFKIMKL